jgi:hypothetical protein
MAETIEQLSAPAARAGAAELRRAPRIANLSNPRYAQRVGPRYGFLDLEFDFEIAAVEADLVVVALEGFGEALNTIAGTAGRSRGRARVGQTVILREPGVEQRFSVRLLDRAGHLSNRLEGSFVTP